MRLYTARVEMDITVNMDTGEVTDVRFVDADVIRKIFTEVK